MAGRPRKNLDSPRELEIIKKLAAKGCNDATIARALQSSPSQFADRKRESVAIADALAEGRGIEHDALFGTLHHAAIDQKNIVAAMFLLKCRHQYREQGELPQNLQVNLGLKVEVLPAALSPDEYKKRMVEGQYQNEISDDQKPVTRRKISRVNLKRT